MAGLDWDDLQFFLALMRAGQLAKAARALRTSHVTVARRIERLEAALGQRLFERAPRGYLPTAAAQRLMARAQRIEAEAQGLAADLAGDGAGLRGALRLSMPEGFGQIFAGQLLADFTQRFPRLSPELVTLPQVMSLSRREADLAISLDPAKSPAYRSAKLCDYSLLIYAAPAYLQAAPPITSRADLPQHRFIGYIEEMIFAPGLDYLDALHPAIRPSVKASSIFSQMAAAQAGQGLCVLPWYLARGAPGLVPVLAQSCQIRRSYWLVAHRDAAQAPRERAVAAWLAEALRARAAALLLGQGDGGPGNTGPTDAAPSA